MRNSHLKLFLEAKYEELGPMKFKEWAVLVYFLLLVVVWFFAEPHFIEGKVYHTFFLERLK